MPYKMTTQTVVHSNLHKNVVQYQVTSSRMEEQQQLYKDSTRHPSATSTAPRPRSSSGSNWKLSVNVHYQVRWLSSHAK